MDGFKAGDMVSVEGRNNKGVGFVYNTDPVQPGCGVLKVSIAWSDGGCTDGLNLNDFRKVEKVGLLTDEKGKKIIHELDEFCTGLDKYSLGLPSGVDHTGEMIYIIKMGLIDETVD